MPRSSKLGRKGVGSLRIGKAPPDEFIRLLVAPSTVSGLDATGHVPVVHHIQTATETVRRHDDFDDMRIGPLYGLGGCAIFGAAHDRKITSRGSGRFAFAP